MIDFSSEVLGSTLAAVSEVSNSGPESVFSDEIGVLGVCRSFICGQLPIALQFLLPVAVFEAEKLTKLTLELIKLSIF